METEARTPSSAIQHYDSTCSDENRSHVGPHRAHSSSVNATAFEARARTQIELGGHPNTYDQSFPAFHSLHRVNDNLNEASFLPRALHNPEIALPPTSSSSRSPSTFLGTSRTHHGRSSDVDVSNHLDPEIRGHLQVNASYTTSAGSGSHLIGHQERRTAHEDPSESR